MANLMLTGDEDMLAHNSIVKKVYDPACGTGGMLTVSAINPNDETYAVCKSDRLIKGDGRDADTIKPDSSFSRDGHPNMTFDYMISNPPYGKSWKKGADFIRAEHARGSGESEIRRWILENDWLEGIVALPDQLFYNTGISTYIWVLSNRKEERRKGKVQLIDATGCYVKMRKSLGDKRHEITDEQIQEITRLFRTFAESEHVKIFDTTDFGYRKITVERPLRLNFAITPERIARLRSERAFVNLATTRKKGEAGLVEVAEGKRLQREILVLLLQGMAGDQVYLNREAFERVLAAGFEGMNLRSPVRRAILSALGKRDENASVCVDAKGQPDPDPDLRDTENVPLGEHKR